jgi:4-carboxymuconolactone decarboxylase
MSTAKITRRRAASLPLLALVAAGGAPILPTSKGYAMADTPAPRKSPFGDIAPALGKYTDDVLFGDVWKRPQLSPRDRSLVTVSNELRFHLKFALQNGVTREELIETITHLAFYAGWPTASTAIGIAHRGFAEDGK